MMTLEIVNWSKALSAAVLPVVLISACSLMSLAFYNRLAAIVGRLRAFQRERLKKMDEIQRNGEDHPMAQYTRRLIDLQESQTHGVLRRARLLQWTLVCLLIAIALLLLSSIALGLSAIVSDSLIPAAAICFFAGAAFILAAVAFAIAELRTALIPIETESEFIGDLASEF